MCAAAEAGLERFDSRAVSGRTHLHVLGLLPQSLEHQFRSSHRPPAAQQDTRAATCRSRRRSVGSRSRACERSRADVDRAEREIDAEARGQESGGEKIAPEARDRRQVENLSIASGKRRFAEAAISRRALARADARPIRHPNVHKTDGIEDEQSAASAPRLPTPSAAAIRGNPGNRRKY